jgi:hypothetical protein
VTFIVYVNEQDVATASGIKRGNDPATGDVVYAARFKTVTRNEGSWDTATGKVEDYWTIKFISAGPDCSAVNLAQQSPTSAPRVFEFATNSDEQEIEPLPIGPVDGDCATKTMFFLEDEKYTPTDPFFFFIKHQATYGLEGSSQPDNGNGSKLTVFWDEGAMLPIVSSLGAPTDNNGNYMFSAYFLTCTAAMADSPQGCNELNGALDEIEFILPSAPSGPDCSAV